MFRFKLHFFLLGGGLSTVLPFVAVFARNTLQLSATSFGAVMTFQQFSFVLTKPIIGYITDYFNKLKLIIFLLAVGQGVFLFLLLLIPPLPKEVTRTSLKDLADLPTFTKYPADLPTSTKYPEDLPISTKYPADLRTSIEDPVDIHTSIEEPANKRISIEEPSDRRISIENITDLLISIENVTDLSTSTKNAENLSKSIKNLTDSPTSEKDQADSITDACVYCYNINAIVKTKKISVHFNEDDASRYIYLSQVRECFGHSTMDSENYDKITVHMPCHFTEDGSYRFPNDTTMASIKTLPPYNQTYFKVYACESPNSSNITCAFMINKCIICCNADSECFMIPDFQGNFEIQEKSMSFKNDFLTFQFWLFAILFVGVNACVNAIYTLSDTALYESVQIHGGEFGRQRLFSCVGWGLGAVVGGLLTDYTDSYHANFTVFAILSLATLWNIYKLDFIKPKQSNNIIKDIRTTMKSTEFLCFEAGVLLMGIGLGFTWFHLIWFVTSIGGNRLVCGLVQTVQSFAGDVPFFFASGWVLRKIGYFNIMSLALIACAVRFLWYSQLHNPWLVLPMEWTHGLTYGLFYAAMASFAKKYAKPGTEATSQSVIFATFDGLGAGIGNIIAGIGQDYIGGRSMFFYTGIFFCCCSTISLLCSYNFRRRDKINEAVHT